MRNFRLNTAFIGGLLASTVLSAPALAQSATDAQTYFNLDRNGVDLTERTFNLSQQDLSIGPDGPGGLSYVRTYGKGGWDANVDWSISRTTSGGNTIVTIRQGNVREQFVLSGSTWVSLSGSGSTLTGSGILYTYTRADGTQAVLRYQTVSLSTVRHIETLTYPTGEVWTFTHTQRTENGPGCTVRPCPDYYTYERLASVTTNTGYRLQFSYAGSGGMSPLEDWQRRTAVKAIDHAVEYCTTSCTNPWPTATFGETTVNASTRILTATDPEGRISKYTMVNGFLAGISFPGDLADTILIGRDASGTFDPVTSFTRGGSTWNYAAVDSGSTRTVTVTDPNSKTRVVVSNMAIGRPTSDTNEVGKTTSFQYDTSGRLKRVTQPEANYVEYTYNGRGNVTQTRQASKSGPVRKSSPWQPSLRHAATRRPATSRPAAPTRAARSLTLPMIPTMAAC